MATVALLFLVVLTAGLFAGSRYAARREQHLRHYRDWSQVFFDATRPLVQDDRTPVEVLRIIAFLNRELVSETAARQALRAFMFFPDDRESRATSELHQELVAFQKLRPDLAAAFDRACHSGMRAISYRSFLAGGILRRFYLFDDQIAQERPRQLAERFRVRNPDDAGHCPMAA